VGTIQNELNDFLQKPTGNHVSANECDPGTNLFVSRGITVLSKFTVRHMGRNRVRQQRREGEGRGELYLIRSKISPLIGLDFTFATGAVHESVCAAVTYVTFCCSDSKQQLWNSDTLYSVRLRI